MGCTNILSNTLCFECRDKEWIDPKKEYFCKRFDRPLERLDGNSGGAVKTMLCISRQGKKPKK